MDLDFYNPITNPGVVAKIRTDGDGISNSFGALSFHTTRTPNSLVERIRITSAGNVGIGTSTFVADPGILTLSKGITFPATQVASADANTLDDYEFGTFTATLTSETPPTTPVTATAKYLKVGDQVTMWFEFNNVNITGAAGTISITGLPFTSSATGWAIGSASVGRANAHQACTITASATNLNIVDGGMSNIAWASDGTGTYVRLSITYTV